jgi:hypothetical protein
VRNISLMSSSRYWAKVALGCLHRSNAIDIWATLKHEAQEDTLFERSVSAFDLFILDDVHGADLDEVSDPLTNRSLVRIADKKLPDS